MIEIQETGSYFNTDKEGFLINPASVDKIQEEWRPLVDAIVESYKSMYGDTLVSVYIRGSVGKGEAIKHVSDVDSFAYADVSKEEIDWDVLKKHEEQLVAQFPFTCGIEYEVDPIDVATKNQFFIGQAALVYGKDLLTDKFKIGKDIMFHSKHPEKVRARVEHNLGTDDSEENIKAGCVWLCKQLLRSGIELCYERSGRYSRDLYRCWETFSEYYPEKAHDMKNVLHLALNPTGDKQEVLDLEEQWTQWLIEEKRNLAY